MYKGKKILSLIPARGGSKGLVKKNIQLLLGKPLIGWTIEQALASPYIDKVIVSTDNEQIAEVAKSFQAEVPFMRPKELATDQAKTSDVILHALEYLKSQGLSFDYLVLLEPTSPLREVEDINKSLMTLIDNPSNKSIVSVAKLEGTHPAFNVVIDPATGCLKKMDGGTSFNSIRRQDLLDVYFFEGTIYISEVATFLEKKTFFHESTLPYVVPRWKSLEIDELFELICAEALLQARLKGLF
jgi:CMP-N,N'-diacetyllegionaminic acid synthase